MLIGGQGADLFGFDYSIAPITAFSINGVAWGVTLLGCGQLYDVTRNDFVQNPER